MVKSVNQQAGISNQHGLTLLELIITIIIIGILAVTILPRFSGTDGYEAYTYRAQAISILRNVQMRAMQKATPEGVATGCYHVLISEKNLGVPNKASCASAFGAGFGHKEATANTIELAIDNNHEVIFRLKDSSLESFNIGFNQQGIPEANCSSGSGCILQIVGMQTLEIKIEAQGYIHAL